MNNTKDYYKILQVSEFAEPEVIKVAYKVLIQKYHPDKNPSKDATKLTLELIEAYKVLGNPDKRNNYNRFLGVPTIKSPGNGLVTRERAIKMLTSKEPGITVWNQFRDHNGNNVPDLSGANLKGANLTSANLSNVRLCGANLQGAILRYTNFTNANIEGANLSKAITYDAYFIRANLSRANLTAIKGYNPSGRSYYITNLEGANLTCANLESANLEMANLKNANVKDAILVNTRLEYAKLKGVKLYLALDLTGAKIPILE
ncbi:MAG: pentapeptide repeat-containing protein [Pseudomonadota bacterium]